MHIQRNEMGFQIHDLPFDELWPVPYDAKLGKQMNRLLSGECSTQELEQLVINMYCQGLTPDRIVKGVQRIRVQAFAEGMSIGQTIIAHASAN